MKHVHIDGYTRVVPDYDRWFCEGDVHEHRSAEAAARCEATTVLVTRSGMTFRESRRSLAIDDKYRREHNLPPRANAAQPVEAKQ